MDAFTLQVAALLASAVMAISMFGLHRASRREICLRDWAVAGMCFFSSSALGWAAQSQGLSYWIAPALANSFYICAHAAILVGVRRHMGLSAHARLLPLLGAVALAMHALPFAQAAVANRLMLTYPVIMACNLAVIALLWRAPASEMTPAYWPLLLTELLFLLQLLMRAAMVLMGDQTALTLFGSQFVQTSGSLALLAFLSLATMSCALMVIRKQELRLRRASRTDKLTGWLNRHALHEMAQREFQRHARQAERLVFMMFDIDHFKSINDSHGHAAGDAAIRHATAQAATALRGYDALFRIGGEEFLVLISTPDESAALEVAERVRARIQAQAVEFEGKAIAMTVSLGLATRQADDQNWEQVLQRADQALYAAKKAGRNCVHCYTHEPEPAPRMQLLTPA
ncbi:GGDEF domain-containing protein [Paucibacter soli]|uniref:GGDEF domain-containing protein n=1 Tax=Paucibacter soli TaxID=3133433 RepID=UPI0030B128FB